MTTFACLVQCVALVLALALVLCAGQGPTPLPVPCASAATHELAVACVANLTFTHLYYEQNGIYDELVGTMSADAYEYYSHTLMGGLNSAPWTSDQSLYHMYAAILNGGQPDDLVYISVSEVFAADKVVFEYIAQFNHSVNFWLAPYPPTYRKVSLVMVLSIGYDAANKMTYERLYVDGASLLVQIGVLPDGYGVYGNDIDRPYRPSHACRHPLPVIGDELTTLLTQGPNTSDIMFNGFYVNEATSGPCADEPTQARRSSKTAEARTNEPRAFTSFADMVHYKLASR